MTLKQIIVEIHRRSLWQVLTIYLGASWAVMEATDQIVDRYLLPEWVYPAVLIILLVGLPLVLATAFVREERDERRVSAPRDPTLLGESTAPDIDRPIATLSPKPAARLFTWPRAILGGVLAFAGLALLSTLVVMRGTARVTEAYGAAGESFAERAWIVVAEFAAPENEADVALAAKTALLLDLAQSEYVNVRGPSQIAPVLARMGLPDTTRLDERLALEVAEREGLAAVLAGSVSRLGGDYVLGARVLKPDGGEELITVRAAVGAERLLEGVESLTREVRGRLGEKASDISRSRPLPEVTTRSLEALKVYAQAVEANESNRPEQAARLAEDAIRLDSSFAMAYRIASVASRNAARVGEARRYAARAYELRDRLTDRERFHVEANYYWTVELDPARTAAAYEHVLTRYPDDDWAANNLAIAAGWLGDTEREYRGYRQAVALNPYSEIAYGNAVSAALRTGRWAAAESLAAAAASNGFELAAARARRDRAIAGEDWTRAEALCDSLLSALSSDAQHFARESSDCGALDIARGRIARGVARVEASQRFYLERGAPLAAGAQFVELTLAEHLRGSPRDARARLLDQADRFPGDVFSPFERMIMRNVSRVIAAELGSSELADRLAAAYAPFPDTALWVAQYSETMGKAARALSQGRPAEALALLREAQAFGKAPPPAANLARIVSGLSFDELGQPDSAAAYLEAAADIGRAAGNNWARVHFPILLRKLADVEEERGDTEAAARYYQRLLALWSDADPELGDQVTSAQRALARLTGAESS